MSGLGLLRDLVGASVAGLSGRVHWTFPGCRATGYGQGSPNTLWVPWAQLEPVTPVTLS